MRRVSLLLPLLLSGCLFSSSGETEKQTYTIRAEIIATPNEFFSAHTIFTHVHKESNLQSVWSYTYEITLEPNKSSIVGFRASWRLSNSNTRRLEGKLYINGILKDADTGSNSIECRYSIP